MSSSCPICLEPFFPTATTTNSSTNNEEETALGALDPCGHIFHVHCFAIWKASQGSRCKCPECNQIVKKCIKLFGIAPPEGTELCVVGQEDDDLSLSSAEEDEHEHGEKQSSTVHNPICDDDNDEDDHSVQIMQVVEARPCSTIEGIPPHAVVDMTTISSTPLHPSQQQSPLLSSNANGNEASTDLTARKYKHAAQKYKRLFKQKDSQCRELNKERQTLIELHSSTSQENNGLQAELKIWNDESELRNAQLDAANLKVVRLTDQLDRLKGQMEDLRRQRDAWTTKYVELQRSFQKEVQRVKTSDMAEVQQMMDERHKLLADNERLIREHADAVSQASKLRVMLRQAAAAQTMASSSSTTTTSGKAKPTLSLMATNSIISLAQDKKRKASSIAKELRSMEHARFPTNLTTTATTTTPASALRGGAPDLSCPLPLSTKMSARSNTLMEKVLQRQQQLGVQKQTLATAALVAATVQGQRCNKNVPPVLGGTSVVPDGVHTSRLLPSTTTSSRRISLDSAESQHTSLPRRRGPPSTIGLRISSSKKATFQFR